MIQTFNPDEILRTLNEFIGTNHVSVADAFLEFLQADLSDTSQDLLDLEMRWLQKKTGQTSRSIPDLWRYYFSAITTIGDPSLDLWTNAFNEARVATTISEGAELGSELITNGTFDTDLSGWSNDGSFVWDNGVARDNSTAAGSNLMQVALESGKRYLATFDINEISGGQPSANFGGSAIETYSTNGSKSIESIADGNSISFKGDAALFTLDNISVKEVLPTWIA